jgi:hypothetical protein
LFEPGQALARRSYRGPHLSWAQAVTVVSDDERGLLLWLPAGADFAYRAGPDGRGLRAGTVEEFGAAPLIVGSWRRSSVLLLNPPDVAHSVWWFFRGGVFTHWYVNLESPYARDPGGIGIVDHHLDLVVRADRQWRWKDEDDFAASTGCPGYWDAGQAAEIRSEGLRAVAVVESGAFPFDGTWCDFAPDPGWPVPRLPQDIVGMGTPTSVRSSWE